MTKLNQVLAIEKNRRTQHHAAISELHHATKKATSLNGHHKVFTPKDDDGETFPDDVKRVEVIATSALEQVSKHLTSLFDVTATKDWANCDAKADVIVDDKVFLAQVPVPFLLFLEKELHDLLIFVTEIVELEPGENWTLDANSGLFKSDPVKTQRTKKMQKPIVMYPHSEHHPAQTQLITEDVVIGTWTTTKFSGAISSPERKRLLARISKLEEAVKFAREHANSLEVVERKVGQTVLDYIFSVAP
jgi:hypothetical protein